MGKTLIEKIIGVHSGKEVKPGDIVDMGIDVRVARDFGGANVVKDLESNNLGVADPTKTFFTFDCNPTGSDQKYATNQQICRLFARKHNIKVYDINTGIGTHLAMDEGLISPGGTLVSTDSHANIVGAIGAFGQGMGDEDIAYAFAKGKVWFKVPQTIKIILNGIPILDISYKDIVLAILKELGADGMLGLCAEFYGEYVDKISLDGRITIASMATEMGGICILFPPNQEVIEYCRKAGTDYNLSLQTPVYADKDAKYMKTIEIRIDNIKPLISRPGHPEDVVPVEEVTGRQIDSAFIGSCTNGRYEDMLIVANILKGRKVAPGVILKIVPSTDKIWQRCLNEGLISIFKSAGALVGNAGCAGCAAGQIGQNGIAEITISTGNRNFAGKQGKGEVYLASPATVAASSIAGYITTANNIPDKVQIPKSKVQINTKYQETAKEGSAGSPDPAILERPTKIKGKVWIVAHDNIDTDMIYHNSHLAITDIQQMGQYTFGNLPGWQDFPKKVQEGDVVIVGSNFGCGSSRQQAVDCFRAIKVGAIIAKSFGAIYERNAINTGFPIIVAQEIDKLDLHNGDEIEVNFLTGEIHTLKPADTEIINGEPFSEVQIEIYQRGGLLK
ncbi:MAG: 3-isopropylmalate dehydratase large subunit [Candidatus Stahlbacteria bacterium]|nr:3-isopropylmalate dehydratase large subunit [Candidatus Stahlbacteria bacterium]